MSDHSQHAHHLVGPGGHLTPLTGCGACLDNAAHSHAPADMAHRDDLARDVALAWVDQRRRGGPVGTGFAAALDRLASAHGVETER